MSLLGGGEMGSVDAHLDLGQVKAREVGGLLVREPEGRKSKALPPCRSTRVLLQSFMKGSPVSCGLMQNHDA